MLEILDSIRDLYRKTEGTDPESLDVLPQSEVERRYFRLHGKKHVRSAPMVPICRRMKPLFISPANSIPKDWLYPRYVAVSDDLEVLSAGRFWRCIITEPPRSRWFCQTGL